MSCYPGYQTLFKRKFSFRESLVPRVVSCPVERLSSMYVNSDFWRSFELPFAKQPCSKIIYFRLIFSNTIKPVKMLLKGCRHQFPGDRKIFESQYFPLWRFLPPPTSLLALPIYFENFPWPSKRSRTVLQNSSVAAYSFFNFYVRLQLCQNKTRSLSQATYFTLKKF